MIQRAPVAALALLLCLAPARPAHADASSALYEDIKDVIEDVIQSELAQSVVRVVETRSPALGFYFRGSLDRLSSPYWGNLTERLREDLINLVSDFVYWDLAEASDATDVASNLRDFFACLDPEGSSNLRCADLRKALFDEKRPIVEVRCRTLAGEAAEPTGTDRVACDLALATRAGLSRKTAMAVRHVIDAVTDILLHDVQVPALARDLQRTALGWLRDPATFPPQFQALLLDRKTDLGSLTARVIRRTCGDREEYGRLLADAPDALAWVCFATGDEGLPAALRFTVTLAGGKQSFTAPIDYWLVESLLARTDQQADEARPRDQVLYDAFVKEAAHVLCARRSKPQGSEAELLAAGDIGYGSNKLDEDGPATQPAPIANAPWLTCTDGRVASLVQTGLTVSIDWLGESFSARVDPRGRFQADAPVALARRVKSFIGLMQRLQAMRDLMPPGLASVLFLRDRGDSSRAVPALKGLLRIGRLVSELRSRWYLWPEEKDLGDADRLASMNLGGLLELALELAPQGAGLASLQRTQKQLRAEGGFDLSQMLALAFRGEYRELAVESLRVALRLRKGESSAARPHETFFISLCAYMLDDPGQGSTDVTRSAFRAAARQLIDSVPRAGVPTHAKPWRLAWLPRLGLRLSFDEYYRGESQRDGYRTAVTAEWPTVLWAFSDFAGLELSVLDPVAPLAELALRPIGEWSDQRLLALDIVRPRVGLWIAIPQLTRRLSLSAGVGPRFVGVEADPASTDDTFVGRYTTAVSLFVDAGVELIF